MDSGSADGNSVPVKGDLVLEEINPTSDAPTTPSPVKSCMKNSSSTKSKKTVSVSGDEPDPSRSINAQVSIHEKIEVIEVPDYPGEDAFSSSPPPDMKEGWNIGDTATTTCMTFQNVYYEVRQLKTKKCRVRLTKKRILNNVSGVMVPGINAIMGPTGGGKTTLLDILAQRKGTSGCKQSIRGTILLNREPLPHDFKLTTGYVVQEDILEGVLTVRENIEFSASLRLDRAVVPSDERSRRVTKIITQLGLTSAENTVVGTEFIRGVSGGERKRTVIAMELITNPTILFMDEPTTGLDAHTAVSVVQTLQDWCLQNNRLVIMSIHQPRYSIYKLFDSLTLLSLGSVVYQGKASHAVEYFGRLGFGLEERENPADFVLDIINDSQSVIATHRRTIRKVKPQDKPDLIAEFKSSEEAQMIEKTLDNVSIEARYGSVAGYFHQLYTSYGKGLPRYIYIFILQVLILAVRSTKANFRNPTTMLFQVIVMATIAFVVGVVYFQLDDMEFNILDKYVSDRIGAMFLIVLTQEFGVLSGFDLFISQRALFIHENASGFYRVSSYFVSKIITDVIPLRIVPILLFSVIIYFMIGFQVAADKFFIFLLILSLGAVTLSSIAFAISAIIKNRSIAIVVFSLINLTSILFSGIVISLSSLPEFLAWLQYLSVYNYVVQSLAINEISGVFYNATPEENNGICSQFAGCLNGTLALETNDFRTDYDFIWISVGALIAITIGLWALTYVLLRCAKKHK